MLLAFTFHHSARIRYSPKIYLLLIKTRFAKSKKIELDETVFNRINYCLKEKRIAKFANKNLLSKSEVYVLRLTIRIYKFLLYY